ALHGISEGLVRLSIGLEGIDDVIFELEQALPKRSVYSAA
ncbi:MAG: methionine-gamma-lyase, partial [Octadecabacter sp.]